MNKLNSKEVTTQVRTIKSYIKEGNMNNYSGFRKLAKKLGISERTLYRRMSDYSIPTMRNRRRSSSSKSYKS